MNFLGLLRHGRSGYGPQTAAGASTRRVAALFGWAIYSTTPAAVSAVITMTAGQRITSMRAQQKELMMKWGPDVESVYEPAGAAAQKQATAEPMAQKR